MIELESGISGMGARIAGAGSDVITIQGVSSLGAAQHSVVADRVEAGSYAIAVAMTGGDLCLKKMVPPHLESLFDVLRQAGVKIDSRANEVRVRSDGQYRGIDIETQPYPGFPTDLQAQFMAMMCLAEGYSKISETIFENRFMHVQELNRLGAKIEIQGNMAVVKCVSSLTGAEVMATDLRASAGLVIACLIAANETTIGRIYHLDRCYERIEEKLRSLRAYIS